MTIFDYSESFSIPFECPVCGKNVDVENFAEYCEHVEFVWVWSDPNAWAYVRQDFADEYIEILMEKYGLYHGEFEDEEDDEVEENVDKIIESFVACTFEPGDEVAERVPFNEKIIEEIADNRDISLFEASRTYSGVVVGIRQ